MMGSMAGFSCALCFILATLIVISVAANGDFGTFNNVTGDMISGRSGRLKRAPTETLPIRLKMKIKYATEAELDMTWYLVPFRYLANEHLPVIQPLVDSNPQLMQYIGNFEMYQNVKDSSALVYFVNLKTLYGVIGMNYVIEALPFEFNEYGDYKSGTVGDPFVQKYKHHIPHIFPDAILPPPSDLDAWKDYTRPAIEVPLVGTKRKAKCRQGPSAKKPTGSGHADEAETKSGLPITYQSYFSETLILVTRDMAELFKQQYGAHYIQWLVIYYILNFSSVDMIFQQLQHKKFDFHPNIAKIVIEDEWGPFTFSNDDELQFTQIVAQLPNYLEANAVDYPPDSFDHVLISTSRPVYDDDFSVIGRTKYGADLYGARKENKFYTEVPITTMTFQHFYTDYITIVHEVARTLNMKIDLREHGSTSSGQCYGIMQREGPKCNSCLKWSEDSQRQYTKFFYGNRNRCFLMNTPRSIRSPRIGTYTSANRQCQCFGYVGSVVRRSVGKHACLKPLQCKTSTSVADQFEETVRPFDGTVCAYNKICWGGKCEKVKSENE